MHDLSIFCHWLLNGLVIVLVSFLLSKRIRALANIMGFNFNWAFRQFRKEKVWQLLNVPFFRLVHLRIFLYLPFFSQAKPSLLSLKPPWQPHWSLTTPPNTTTLHQTHTPPPQLHPPLSLHPNTATHASTPHPYPPSPHASVSTMSLDVVLNSMLLHHHNCIMDRVIYNANVLWITQFTIHLWMVRQNGGFSATWRFGESQWCDMKVWRWSWSMAVVLGGGQVWWTWRFGGGVLLGRRRVKRDIRKCGVYPEKMRRLK